LVSSLILSGREPRLFFFLNGNASQYGRLPVMGILSYRGIPLIYAEQRLTGAKRENEVLSQMGHTGVRNQWHGEDEYDSISGTVASPPPDSWPR
jgi:hypothetical protein